MCCWHQLPRVLSRRGRSLGLRPRDPLNIHPIAILQLSIIVNSKAIATGTKRYGYSRNQSCAWEIVYKCNTRIPNDRLMTDTAGFKFTNFISRKSVYPYICDLASWNFNHYFCVGFGGESPNSFRTIKFHIRLSRYIYFHIFLKILIIDSLSCHYGDVIVSAMASQITGVLIGYLTLLFRRRSKETSKLRITGLCEGNSSVTGEFPAQRASNAKNVSIWWRHHVLVQAGVIHPRLGLYSPCVAYVFLCVPEILLYKVCGILQCIKCQDLYVISLCDPINTL